MVAALVFNLACTATPSPTPVASFSPPTATSEPGNSKPTSSSGPAEQTSSPSATPVTSEHRIGVRYVDGIGEFYDRLTGERFTPRGNNLIRLDTYHNTFNPRSYNRADLDRQLSRMADLGYNVVRVFLDHRHGGLTATGESGLSSAYLDNLADFLGLARSHRLYVMVTQDWLPDDLYPMNETSTVRDVNIGYLTRSGIDANRAYFRDLATGLIERGAPLDAIWAYELRNELSMLADQAPFSLNSGTLQAPNGHVYDLADATQRRALLEDGIVYWTDTVRAAILDVDPTALVSVGFFVPQGPNSTRVGDNRIVETAEELTDSTADFVDLHGYPGADLPLPLHLENFGLEPPYAKPVVMGEMGAFVSVYPVLGRAVQALISWQADSCAFGFDGWLLWTWDTPGEIWSAVDGDGALANALAPINRPDPCSAVGGVPRNLAFGQPVRTSAQLAEAPGSAAVDGVSGTIWSSGAFAPQWIEVDLAEPITEGTVRLVVSQYPSGRTVHHIFGRSERGARLEPIDTLSGDTSDGQELVLQLLLDAPIRVLRIETTASPSWIGWREIVVNPADSSVGQ